MTKIAEKQILSELSSLKQEVGEIKQYFTYLVDEDFWIYEPEVRNHLRKRFKKAEQEFQAGKSQPIEKLWKELEV